MSAEAEEEWVQGIVDDYIDASRVMSACTPSRINNEGHPEDVSPLAGAYGGRLGDWFGYRELLERWLEDGTLRRPGARSPLDARREPRASGWPS